MKKVEGEGTPSDASSPALPGAPPTPILPAPSTTSAGWYRFANYLQLVKSGAYYRYPTLDNTLTPHTLIYNTDPAHSRES